MVKFIGAIEHGLKHGYYSKDRGFSTNKGWWDNCMVVLKGQREYVVECDDEGLVKEMKSLPNDSFLFQKLKVVTDFLDKRNVKWEITGKSSKI